MLYKGWNGIKVDGTIFMEGGNKGSDNFTLFLIFIRHELHLSISKKEFIRTPKPLFQFKFQLSCWTDQTTLMKRFCDLYRVPSSTFKKVI